ncbi:phosphoribosylanthranilate isomerase [Chryseobacterium sp. T16E-39]|uniref:phosphoribosylanthranilate isomerase n=1 Tax=Chryseobacterium sp. T16E-39 TaxID=2015076 RepID=UPI000B5B398E|nr:phosphoribosylanthranilate isomerase [Chryseobacterium sp. T16E-39]ASK32566.1 phosphoribosylanthranilate isomerase [Chryseobacterium sp. T16E-39]
MNQQLQLKVCGLTQLNQIQELISLNIDFLGFIFYKKSPRYALNRLSLEDISKINHPRKVGVFVNESIEDILNITKSADLDFIQIHGDENEDYISALKREMDPKVKIIKVFRIGETIEDLKFKIEHLQPLVDYLLFDTDSQSFGGTGKKFDWSLLNDLKIEIPYLLSGGISEENTKGIEVLHQKPFALDINSKFEIQPGIKDLNKISAFKLNLLTLAL